MEVIKGIVLSVSGPREFNNVMQIGFTLTKDKSKWYNIPGEEKELEALKKNIIIKGAEISFSYDSQEKEVKNLALEQKPESRPEKNGTEKRGKDNVINIQGKDFMTYEGLLKKAHERKEIFSMQITDSWVSEDMKMAWCKVRLVASSGETTQTFDGFGSSTPDNTGTMTQSHPVEMAHTRAKGRALRDFLNIGQVMAEEIKQDK